MKVIPGKSLNIILQEDTETLEEVVVSVMVCRRNQM